MKSLAVAVFVILGLVALSNPISAGETPTPTPASSAAPADSSALPRFGYIQPAAQSETLQPGLDDFANDVAKQLPEAVPVTVLRLLDGGLKAALKASTCEALHLAGYVISHRQRSGNASGLNVEAKVEILDCQGSVFYQAVGTYAERRDNTMSREGQLDAVQSKAVKAAAGKVLDFKNSHEAAWDRFVQSGSINSSTTPPSVAPSPRASGASASPHP